MKQILVVLVVMGLVFASGPVWAKDGWYLGMDVGITVAPGMAVNGSDNDQGARCDQAYNPNLRATCLTTREEADKYSGDQWASGLEGGTGVLAGVAVGYRLRNFRVEGEYFYRSTTHDDMDQDTRLGDESTATDNAELAALEFGVDDVLSHNFFANLYYDYRSDSKLTPYVGFGVGFSRVSLDYFGRFQRSSDPADIATFKNRDGSQCTETECLALNRRLAGATTIGRGKLSDTLFGYQVLAGLDYQVSEPVSIGLKVRWADFGEFQSDPREWDQLRSHDSVLDPAGTLRVRYKAMTEDIQFWGVSLTMKYQF